MTEAILVRHYQHPILLLLISEYLTSSARTTLVAIYPGTVLLRFHRFAVCGFHDEFHAIQIAPVQ
ncbi:hypothetical protein GCM10007416_20810 [Kroppenstedtia guangzhouensis]|uniref:Uncharacterized protein n=1 Tax=Kroppenstedtia guangzhouensis TaxID=1274356 RepID=A0ABQ1GNV2_9BACL|nr:hypothetical protein GCM10007416_20810 [Kroppenstedtia guangzhouensis]